MGFDLARAYQIQLMIFISATATCAMITLSPIPAAACGVLCLAFAAEQFRNSFEKKIGVKTRLDEIEAKMAQVHAYIHKVNIQDFMARSDEVRNIFNSMKNPYKRNL